MIADISIGPYVRGLVDYHERKVEENKADRIYNNTIGLTDRDQFVNEFLDTVERNPKSIKNKVAHFSLSFPEGENPSVEKMIEIGEAYLEGMGYTDRPTLMYKHDDTKNSHFHMLVPTCDNNGVKTIERDNFKKSQKLSRELEVKFDLEKTEYRSNNRSKDFTDLQISKYRINKSLNSTEFKSNLKLTDRIEKQIGIEKFKAITEPSKPMNNNQIKKLIGNDNFNFLNHELNKNNLVYYTNKENIYRTLDSVLLQSKNKTEFLEKAKNSGLYVREIKSKDHISFGITNNGKTDYFKDYNISKRFTAKGIEDHFNPGKDYDHKQLKSFLKGNISRIYQQSKTWDEFQIKLKEKGIGLQFNGKPRPSGVSFFSEKSPETLFKGSDIKRDFSFSKLNSYFALNEFSKEDPFKESFSPEHDTPKDLKSNKPFIPGTSNAPSEDEKKEERLRKKREKDKGKGLN
tara:strand:- start:1899 stop:3275 length:1377 start_codon:yes stop_codon:yes gene_type:complete